MAPGVSPVAAARCEPDSHPRATIQIYMVHPETDADVWCDRPAVRHLDLVLSSLGARHLSSVTPGAAVVLIPLVLRFNNLCSHTRDQSFNRQSSFSGLYSGSLIRS